MSVPTVSASSQTLIYGDVGAAYTAEKIYNVHYHRVREALAPHVLDEAEVKRQRALYVAPMREDTPHLDASDAASYLRDCEAARHVRDHSVVALVGKPRSGRKITAINLLDSIGTRPSEITLDPDDLDVPLVEPGHGYLIDADDLGEVVSGKQRTAMLKRLDAVRAQRCVTVIRATETVWRSLAIGGSVPAVSLRPAKAAAIFRSHLTQRTSRDLAERWSHRTEILSRLEGANPSDAVRMADIVWQVLGKARPSDTELDQVSEVLQVYSHWADHLDAWFKAGETNPAVEGRRRVLLLAAAVLETAHAATVFTAAELLAKQLDMQPEIGHGLVGQSAPDRVQAIDAELADDRVSFPRPTYAASALDYMWRHWPQLQKDLRAWLINLPPVLVPEDAARAARSTVELATRQCDPDIVTTAADKWIHEPRTSEIGISVLTLAGISDEVGHAVRRKLYEWSRGSDTDRHRAIIRVCSSTLGEAFPRVALTRLRHIADRSDETIGEAVARAIAQLAVIPRLRAGVLAEIVAWIQGGGDSRRCVGQKAFLKLMVHQNENGSLSIITDPAPSERRLRVLAEGWRALLRAEETNNQARDVAVQWLEAVAMGIAPGEVVIATLADTCQTEYDIGTLSPVVFQWARSCAEPADTARNAIYTELMRRIATRSAFTTTESLGQAFGPAAQESSDGTAGQ